MKIPQYINVFNEIDKFFCKWSFCKRGDDAIIFIICEVYDTWDEDVNKIFLEVLLNRFTELKVLFDNKKEDKDFNNSFTPSFILLSSILIADKCKEDLARIGVRIFDKNNINFNTKEKLISHLLAIES